MEGARWVDLAPEVWHTIMYSYVDVRPCSVVAMARTCKRMHAVLLGDEYSVDMAKALLRPDTLLASWAWRPLRFSIQAGRIKPYFISRSLIDIMDTQNEACGEPGEWRAPEAMVDALAAAVSRWDYRLPYRIPSFFREEHGVEGLHTNVIVWCNTLVELSNTLKLWGERGAGVMAGALARSRWRAAPVQIMHHVGLLGASVGSTRLMGEIGSRLGWGRLGEELNVPGAEEWMGDWTMLHAAAFDGVLESVLFLLALDEREGVDVNAMLDDGVTPLRLAAQVGNVSVVEALLGHKGIDANTKGAEGKASSALWIACAAGEIEVVRLLLAHDKERVDVNAKSPSGGATPLFIACEHGHDHVVTLLLQERREEIDVNAAQAAQATPLYVACQNGHIDVVEILLGVDALDVNAAAEGGMTPLHIAVQRQRHRIVALLLSRAGPAPPALDVNRTMNHGTPLLIAAAKGDLVSVNALLATGMAEVNLVPNHKTPLFRAAVKGHKEVVDALLAVPGIDVNCVSSSGATPLVAAARRGHTDVVRSLLGVEGVDVNAAMLNGTTALHYAVEGGFVDVVRILLEVGELNVNARVDDGATPLMLAVCQETPDVVRALLEREDIDLNARDGGGLTAFHGAVYDGSVLMVSLLLDFGGDGREGVDVNLPNGDGESPLITAVRQHHVDIVRILVASDRAELSLLSSTGQSVYDLVRQLHGMESPLCDVLDV